MLCCFYNTKFCLTTYKVLCLLSLCSSSSSNKMNPNSDCNTEFSLSSTKKSDSTKKADLKERVSNTLNMRRHKKKQLATVKPIKASDEKALESAIAMTNALASKSMHDIDKKSMEQFYEHSPGRSPITPTSPSKKFSFFFPTVNSGKFRSEKKSPSLDSPRNYSTLISLKKRG